MPDATGFCPSCESEGTVGKPCAEKGCLRRGIHAIPADWFRKVREVPPERRDPFLGRKLGEYLVVDTLGKGGFGKVYVALQQPIQMKAALKIMHAENVDPATVGLLVGKFELEAAALAKLSHSNVVRLLQYGLQGDLPYLVMEFVQGRTLKDVISGMVLRGEELDPEVVPHVLRQMLNGLEAAHAVDVIHRDIKPENVMIQPEPGDAWRVRLLDFGLAKFVAERRDNSLAWGTPQYMAPEQVWRKAIGPWTDVYAVGVLAFELMTGRRPFAGRTPQEILTRKLDPGYDVASRVTDLDMPPFVLDFFRRAMARDAAERYRTAPQLREAMDRVFARLEREPSRSVGSGDLSELLDSNDLAKVQAEKQKLDEERKRLEDEKRRVEEDRRRSEIQARKMLEERQALEEEKKRLAAAGLEQKRLQAEAQRAEEMARKAAAERRALEEERKRLAEEQAARTTPIRARGEEPARLTRPIESGETPEPPARRSRRPLWIGVAVVAAGLGTWGGIALLSPGREEAPSMPATPVPVVEPTPAPEKVVKPTPEPAPSPVAVPSPSVAPAPEPVAGTNEVQPVKPLPKKAASGPSGPKRKVKIPF